MLWTLQNLLARISTGDSKRYRDLPLIGVAIITTLMSIMHSSSAGLLRLGQHSFTFRGGTTVAYVGQRQSPPRQKNLGIASGSIHFGRILREDSVGGGAKRFGVANRRLCLIHRGMGVYVMDSRRTLDARETVFPRLRNHGLLAGQLHALFSIQLEGQHL